MSGYSSWWIDGVDIINCGDLLRVDLADWPRGTRWISAVLLDVSEGGEDGEMWMRCLVEGERVRGGTVFSDRWNEVLSVEFGCRANDPCLFLGAGI